MGLLTNISLFSGGGGLDLGAHIAEGFRTVCYCEFDLRAQATLRSRIKDRTLDDAPIWDDVTSFDGKPWAGLVDVVSGGFPCQDVSTAGKRRGIKEGTRSGLWHQFRRIIAEVGPRFVLVENVAGLILGGVSEPFLGPWTSWGMMRGGKLYLPQTSELLISDKECGLLPTPNASEAFHGGKQYLRATETWEDCSCLTAKAIGMAYGLKGRQPRPSGKFILDPSFTEWMMGWPTGHTELSSAEMELYLNRLSQQDGPKSAPLRKKIWP